MIALSTNAIIAIATLSILSGSHLAPTAKSANYYSQSVLPNESSLVMKLNDEQASEKRLRERPNSSDSHGHNHFKSSAAELRSAGKPGSSIAQLQHAQFSTTSQTLKQLQLQLQSPLREGHLVVSLSADDGLDLYTPTSWTLDLDAGDLPVIPVSFLARTDGTFHLHLVVDHQIDGEQVQSRALAAEVRVGAVAINKQFEKSLAKVIYPEVIVLPATESIR